MVNESIARTFSVLVWRQTWNRRFHAMEAAPDADLLGPQWQTCHAELLRLLDDEPRLVQYLGRCRLARAELRHLWQQVRAAPDAAEQGPAWTAARDAYQTALRTAPFLAAVRQP